MWDCFSRFASLRVGFAARSAKDCKDYPRDCRAPSRRTGWKVISCIAYCWFRFEFTSIRMKDLSVEISIDMRDDVPLPLDLAIKQTRRIFQTRFSYSLAFWKLFQHSRHHLWHILWIYFWRHSKKCRFWHQFQLLPHYSYEVLLIFFEVNSTQG